MEITLTLPLDIGMNLASAFHVLFISLRTSYKVTQRMGKDGTKFKTFGIPFQTLSPEMAGLQMISMMTPWHSLRSSEKLASRTWWETTERTSKNKHGGLKSNHRQKRTAKQSLSYIDRLAIVIVSQSIVDSIGLGTC